MKTEIVFTIPDQEEMTISKLRTIADRAEELAGKAEMDPNKVTLRLFVGFGGRINTVRVTLP